MCLIVFDNITSRLIENNKACNKVFTYTRRVNSIQCIQFQRNIDAKEFKNYTLEGGGR